MKLLHLLSLLPVLCSGSPLQYESTNEAEINRQTVMKFHENAVPPTFDRNTDGSDPLRIFPSWSTSHLLARRLLALSTTGVLSTVFQTKGRNADLQGVPIGLPDYIADCVDDEDSPLYFILGPGNPLILGLNIGTAFRNVKAGSNISLAIDWWHTQRQGGDPGKGHNNDHVEDDEEPGFSLAGFPRLALIGTLEPIPQTAPDDTRKLLEKCFLVAHPDASYWLPGNPKSPHSGFWARLIVREAFWVGGFGDRARIGWLDMDAWRKVRKHGKSGESGWDDVKLPGE